MQFQFDFRFSLKLPTFGHDGHKKKYTNAMAETADKYIHNLLWKKKFQITFSFSRSFTLTFILILNYLRSLDRP